MNLEEKLSEIYKNSDNNLEKFVIIDLLSFKDDHDIITYINNVLDYGCIGGVVSELVTYEEGKLFYDKHFNEIWRLITKKAQENNMSPLRFLTENYGLSHQIVDDITLKYYISCFAYENMVEIIKNKLQIA